MKKSIGIMGAAALSVLSFTLQAQQTWDPQKNPTVTAITSKYTGKYIAPPPALTNDEIFPVTGRFQSATNPEASQVTISLDTTNKGVVWIDGLPQGKLKAMLRKLPDTYKIPSQKTEDGKEVAEGTLIYDNETGTLSICIGIPYDNTDPTTAFTPVKEEPVPAAKTKSVTKKTKAPKAWMYTGTKQRIETVSR